MEKIDTNNRTPEEISKMYDALIESIRHYLSAKLMDTDEEHPLDVNIEIDFNAVGLSSLEMPTITSIFQEPKEGIIWVKYDFSDDYVELDELNTEDQMAIVNWI